MSKYFIIDRPRHYIDPTSQEMMELIEATESSDECEFVTFVPNDKGPIQLMFKRTKLDNKQL